VFVLGSSNTEMPTTSFTLHVTHATFLSHIAAHRACAPGGSAAAAAAAPIIVVPWRTWGPGRTHLTTMSNVSQRIRDEHRVCGMHTLGQPHLLNLLDRGVLRIMDYHPHRVARTGTPPPPPCRLIVGTTTRKWKEGEGGGGGRRLWYPAE
jgi:hypothetical protein